MRRSARLFSSRAPFRRQVDDRETGGIDRALVAEPVPRTERQIAAAAAVLGIAVPDACMPGVIDNLAILAGHADTLLDGRPS